MMRFLLPILCLPVIYFSGTLLFNQPGIYCIIIALLFYVYWIYSYPKQHKNTIKKQSAKLLNEGDNSSFFGKKRMDIVEDKLILTEDNATMTLSKDRVKDSKEYDDMSILYLSAVSAYIIPKRYLNDQNITDIRAILK
ncbi:YcxB family protein [Alkalibacterium sp. 20]|uniref:YcxB family protein n=1 Tax=Alkalibacterium sp. 20 TaxID=1798803 RepID=UPI0009F8138B|nr:YcxB family protein [Alkalibacterium sp. 20]